MLEKKFDDEASRDDDRMLDDPALPAYRYQKSKKKKMVRFESESNENVASVRGP